MADNDMALPDGTGFDPLLWREEESAAYAEAMNPPGWHYRDMRNMKVEFMDRFKDLVGDENLRWITFAQRVWPDGAVTQRGQVMISPEGMERVAAFNRHNAAIAHPPVGES